MNGIFDIRYLVAVSFMAFILFGCKKEKNRICELYENPVGYAMGTIDKVVSTPGKATYHYSFEIDGKDYTGKEKAYGIGQGDVIKLGTQFVVIFSVEDPTNNDINTDFLIESEGDFQDFVEEYAENPPPPDFPNNCD